MRKRTLNDYCVILKCTPLVVLEMKLCFMGKEGKMARIEFKYAILDKDDTCGLLEDYSTTVAESPVASLEERIRLAIVNMADDTMIGKLFGCFFDDRED